MTAIIGGGISGLSAAFYALENPKINSIVLYEASNRLGGWVKSIKLANGVIFEKGPRTVRPSGIAGQNTLELVNELNLNENIMPIKRNHPSARNRLIYVNKKLHMVPTSLSKFFKKQEPFHRPLILALWKDLTTKKEVKEDESIYSFTQRRFGKDVADYLINPIICGICAGNAKEISVNFLMKSQFELEQKYGSILKGIFLDNFKAKAMNKEDMNKVNLKMNDLVQKAKLEKWSVWGLKGGLEQLPIALKKNLESKSNVRINTNTKCEQITFKSGEVELSINGKTEKYSRVISSIAAKNLAPLLERQHPQLSRELEAIPFVTVVVVNLLYPKNVLPIEAFGFLASPDENLPILGVTFDSCIFENEVGTVLTVMMGGAWFDKYFDKSATKEYLLSIATQQVKHILNIKEDPVENDVAVLNDCIPQYIVGHSQRLQRIQNYISAHKIPLALCGSSYQGVGLNDVILHI